MGVAAAFRNNINEKSAARARLDRNGNVTVETDMTDIGTGSYTIIAQTAAEMLGVPLGRVDVRLGDSRFPVSAGSGGQRSEEHTYELQSLLRTPYAVIRLNKKKHTPSDIHK